MPMAGAVVADKRKKRVALVTATVTEQVQAFETGARELPCQAAGLAALVVSCSPQLTVGKVQLTETD